jgi:cell division protein FtsN
MSHRLEIDSDEVRAHAPVAPRRRPIKAVLLFIVVMGVAGGSWWAYRTDAPRLPPSAVPVIHSDTAPVKEAPQDPGGMIVPGQDSALLNRDGKGNPKVEQLLPEAEPALPRPAAPPKPAQQIETNTAPTKPPPQIAAAPAPPPAAAPAPPPNPVATAPEAAPLAPAPVIALPPAVNTSAPAAAGTGYRLQLGAVRTEEAAKQEWQRLQRAQSDLLGKLSLTAARVDLGDKGIFYRIQSGPIADGAEAAQSCATLKSRNVGCILVKP